MATLPLTLRLAFQALRQYPARSALSALAVTLGATMVIAGDVVSGAMIAALMRAEDVRAIAQGIFGQLDPLLKGIGAATMLAAGFVIFNALGMSVTQRRRQLGLLRALGLTTAQVWRLVLAEALLVGGAGGALGLALGPLAGRGLIALLKQVDTIVIGAFVEQPPAPLSFALAITLGLGMTLLAAVIPARQATRVSPLSALRPEAHSAHPPQAHRPALLGGALALGLGLWLALAPPANWTQPPLDRALAAALTGVWLLALALLLSAGVGALGRLLQAPLTRLLGAGGRLMADNLRRERGRVLLTASTLAVGLTLIISSAGFFTFFFNELFGPAMRAAANTGGWTISSFPIIEGTHGYANLTSLRLPAGREAELQALLGDRATVGTTDFAIVPELSTFYDAYFSMIVDPGLMRASGFYFKFAQGDWDSAMPLLTNGCGVLLPPAVARQNNAAVGDTLTVTGRAGPVRCTVAGIGETFATAALIGRAAREDFLTGDPFTLFVLQTPGSDRAQLEADLEAWTAANSLYVLSLERLTEAQSVVFDQIPALFNGLLVLAVAAAALGVVNTTLLSVTERRRELAQLRALGATRGQVVALVVGEAALLGLAGGALGLAAGAGFVVILATVYGAHSFGVSGYVPWEAAGRTLQGIVTPGLWGLLAAPIISALAAYGPAARAVHRPPVEALQTN